MSEVEEDSSQDKDMKDESQRDGELNQPPWLDMMKSQYRLPFDCNDPQQTISTYYNDIGSFRAPERMELEELEAEQFGVLNKEFLNGGADILNASTPLSITFVVS